MNVQTLFVRRAPSNLKRMHSLGADFELDVARNCDDEWKLLCASAKQWALLTKTWGRRPLPALDGGPAGGAR
jgi:hypothetical protein